MSIYNDTHTYEVEEYLHNKYKKHFGKSYRNEYYDEIKAKVLEEHGNAEYLEELIEIRLENSYNDLSEKEKSKFLSPDQEDKLNVINPWINPQKQYIPLCTYCKNDYEYYKKKFKENNEFYKCEMDHFGICWWFEWYEKQLKRLNPKVVIVKKNRDNK